MANGLENYLAVTKQHITSHGVKSKGTIRFREGADRPKNMHTVKTAV